MAGASRNKGKCGEREAAALLSLVTGFDVRRRVRQHDGDSDLEGVPNWSIEVKRHATATAGKLSDWWAQAQEQARRTNCLPVLLYRPDRGGWRCVWPSALHLGEQLTQCETPTTATTETHHLDQTLSASPATWWAMCKDHGRPVERP
ncbi:hypothetical protein C5F52_10925 [Limnohabitans sp. TS-CS-82]|uniref:putative PDDEXK endonuclease n=1 Tax=Limnohabitans sp. TS-CS-82 TaxID=2094193 RepID=UPI000CF1F413|nr:hypothetical protein [Limnohabitans sp. TS-CS-82]PQA83207.1 hypothetical protein C5F52_10925 [Limnohabitans sp. TS-CS-82]